MKQEEKKPLDWEAKDPNPPVVEASHTNPRNLR